MRRFLTCLLAAALTSAAPDTAPAEPNAPVAVTSDSLASCVALEDRIDKLPASDEVVRLTDEGREMCQNGRVRGGIIRLRRALMLAHDRTLIVN